MNNDDIQKSLISFLRKRADEIESKGIVPESTAFSGERVPEHDVEKEISSDWAIYKLGRKMSFRVSYTLKED